MDLINPADDLIEGAIEYMRNAQKQDQWCDDKVNGSTKYFAIAATAGALRRLSDFYQQTPATTDKRTEGWLFEVMSEELFERLNDGY